MPDITAEQVAAAEAHLIATKKQKDPEAKREAGQALNDLRSAYRKQEEDAGRRSLGHGVVTEDGGEG